MTECTKCGHDPAVVKDEPLQMLLAASIMVQALRQFEGRICCGACQNALRTILDHFATDSKGSQTQTKVGD